jgi:hypothetical protein
MILVSAAQQCLLLQLALTIAQVYLSPKPVALHQVAFLQ